MKDSERTGDDPAGSRSCLLCNWCGITSEAAFEDQKEIGTKKNITPRGSGDSFSAKANKKESTKKTKKNNNQIKRSYSTGNKKYRKK